MVLTYDMCIPGIIDFQYAVEGPISYDFGYPTNLLACPIEQLARSR